MAICRADLIQLNDRLLVCLSLSASAVPSTAPIIISLVEQWQQTAFLLLITYLLCDQHA